MVFYDGWKLSACILLSLFLQIFLVVAGSFRRLASRRWIVKIIWFAYLLAEFVAVFGLGLIVSRQSLLYNDYKDDIVQVRCMVHGVSDSCKDDHILMYWATFLLVHLGGPDTITAFATEDNELWLRNLFYLSSKCIAVAYAIYQSVETNYRVEVPILLLFLYGIIKCTERTCALYYGSAKSFRNSMLSKSNLGVNDFSKKEDTLLIKMNGEALFNIEVLQCASVFFMTFKGLVVDLSVGIHDLNQSRDFFLQRSSQDAFRLVEVELNYLYDVLFTKIPVLHSKLGLCGRTLSFMAVVSSLVVFYCDFGSKEEKEPLQKKACETILRPKTEVDELVTVCRDKSLFFTASVLARELKDMPSERKWMIISKLWVELLSYAASHVRSSAHAEQLSKGGQLITVVWLLMAHFGLGDHYEIDL
uniref:DUF4220 domain-containing protein n=1 Tax=Daucus carota subsp. sativus TaxID=79200 RepID=A0A166CUY1_DAUCS